MKKVTVLGGSGFVGSSLVTKLDASGYQVTVL
ncbi:MAG: NAD-dependent epimerase/dehydratase family protein, partial [Methylophilus sp.]